MSKRIEINMDTIIFVETTKSGSSREAIKAAERMGYFTVLLTERKSFLVQRKEFNEVHQLIYLIQITEDQIREEIHHLIEQGRLIKAIISFVDPFVSIAAQLSNEICHSNISVEALKKMEDKIATREALKNNSISPDYVILQPPVAFDQLMKEAISRFPVIVKSPVSKASKDVFLVENKLQFEKSVSKIHKLYPSQNILMEEYLIGPQYLVEVIVIHGEIKIVAIIKQVITKEIAFIVTGYEVVVDIDESFYRTIYDAVQSVIRDLQVHNAACHLELRYVDDKWKLIEINPRISGGAMNRMIEETFGINLVKETLRLYLGQELQLNAKFERYIYTHYITINSYGNLIKVTGRNRATSLPGVKEVYIKPRQGAMMTPPLSMGHRYGYVIATGTSSLDAKNNAISAASQIKFYLEPN